MKKLIVLILGMFMISCQENEDSISEFTGKEVIYDLQSASAYNIRGTASIKEKKDGSAQVVIDLKGTDGDIQHPVHLHLGNISAPDAEIAALLNPVSGFTGKSETHLLKLANEQPVSYNDLVTMDACIKIHLTATGPNSIIILAAGNIGKSSQSSAGGRLGISVCKSV